MIGRNRKWCSVVVACAVVMLALAVPAWAGGGEFTAAGSWAKPDDGHSTFNITSEVLWNVGKHLRLGPSATYRDAGDFSGGSAGVAGEVPVGGPFFIGGALWATIGDATDLADYMAQVRAGIEVGADKGGFLKAYAGRTWVRGLSGEIEDPSGTEAVLGVGARW